MQKLKDIDLKGKRALIRVDYNVPMLEGRVQNDFRIRSSIPTIKHCLNNGASVVLMSHLGRPGGQFNDDLSLDPIAFDIEDLLNIDVHFSKDCVSKESIELSHSLKPGEVHLLENLRFHDTETTNDDVFSLLLAQHGDVYINDAFGTAHRAHASNVGVVNHIECAVPGLLMEKEWTYLSQKLSNPEQPYVVILGGSKVSGKIEWIDNLIEKADTILIGGAMAFTFLKAQDKSIGLSLCEDDMIEQASKILDLSKDSGTSILLPVDFVCSKNIEDELNTEIFYSENIPDDYIGLDIGPETSMQYSMILSNAKKVIWNGPMGMFEKNSFATGTQSLAYEIKELTNNNNLNSIVGGGDTVRAIKSFTQSKYFTHVSTGGGASLKLLSGDELNFITTWKNNE